MRIKNEVERYIDYLLVPVFELLGRPGQPESPDIFERGFAGEFFEYSGRVPGRISGSPCEFVQGYRFGKVQIDVILYALYGFDGFSVFRVITSG